MIARSFSSKLHALCGEGKYIPCEDVARYIICTVFSRFVTRMAPSAALSRTCTCIFKLVQMNPCMYIPSGRYLLYIHRYICTVPVSIHVPSPYMACCCLCASDVLQSIQLLRRITRYAAFSYLKQTMGCCHGPEAGVRCLLFA